MCLIIFVYKKTHLFIFSFVVSPDWEYMATESAFACGDDEVIAEIKLWSMIDGGYRYIERGDSNMRVVV